MGTKNQPGRYDCYANALPDEPMFILLARDPDAADHVDCWARVREVGIEYGQFPEKDTALVAEARQCASNMRAWRKANDGAWRAPGKPRGGQTREEVDPADLWDDYLSELDGDEPSPQGAMAFAVDALSKPRGEPAREGGE